MNALTKTEFNFKGQTAVYHGKVRDVYTINDDLMVMVATDRISAFDVILPKGIPFKGQVLNQIAGIPRGDDHPWHPYRFCMARLQERLP